MPSYIAAKQKLTQENGMFRAHYANRLENKTIKISSQTIVQPCSASHLKQKIDNVLNQQELYTFRLGSAAEFVECFKGILFIFVREKKSFQNSQKASTIFHSYCYI